MGLRREDLTEDELEHERRLREGGASQKSRARALGMSQSRYRSQMVARYGLAWQEGRSGAVQGVKRRATPKNLTAGQIRRAKNDLTDGMSMKQVAKRYSIPVARMIELVGAEWWRNCPGRKPDNFESAVAYTGPRSTKARDLTGRSWAKS